MIYPILFIACLSDLKYQKVFNSFLLISFVILFIEVILFCPVKQMVQIIEAGIAFVGVTSLALLIAFLLYCTRAIGGGDAKLLALCAYSITLKKYGVLLILALVIGAFMGMISYLIKRKKQHLVTMKIHFTIPIFLAYIFLKGGFL